jgi:hypothetical protein
MEKFNKTSCIMVNKILFISFIIITFSASTLNAQCLEAKGNGYFKLGSWFLEADRHYTDTGAIDPNATRGVFNLSLYGKYGLSKDWNVIAYIPFYVKTYQNHQVSEITGNTLAKCEYYSSFGDVNLGVEHRLFKSSKHAFSTRLTLGIPSGNNKGGSDGSYQTGDGEFNQILQFNFGTSYKIGGRPFYGKSAVGFNNRTKNFSDEIRIGIETGTSFKNKTIWVLLRSNLVKSLKNGSLSAANSNGSIFANNVEFLGISGEVSWKFGPNFGISFGYQSAFYGRVIYAAPSYSTGGVL